MDQPNQHNYPPLDPFHNVPPEQLEALVNELLQSKMTEMSRSFAQEWGKREQNFVAENAELRAQLEAANDQIARMQLAVNTPMAGPTSAKSASTSSVNTTVPRNARNRKQPEIPDSAPARNLRSRTKAVSGSQTISAGAPVDKTIAALGTANTRTANPKSDRLPHPRAPSKVKGKTVVKPPTHIYRLTAREVPEDAAGVKKALEAHVHILWGLTTTKAVPSDPPVKLLSTFDTRFSASTENDLYHQIANGQSLMLPSLVQIAVGISPNNRSKLAASTKRMEEHILEYIQTCLSKFGLWCWCPDLRQSPYSLYNAACRLVALDTFKQALISHSYAHFNPKLSYAKNLTFLVQLYDHIVHHYIYSRYMRDKKNPGIVQAADNASPQYHNRSRLAVARLEFLQNNLYPQRYVDLIDPKTTSDDEPDPDDVTNNGQLIYWIRKRPERSGEANIFIRKLDQDRERAARLDPSRRWRERLRMLPPDNKKDTLFPTLPLSIPIDYYDPDFYNKLPPRLRSRVATQQVAFLPDVSKSFGGHADEKLDDKAFTTKYGDAVFAKYDVRDRTDFDNEEEEEAEDFVNIDNNDEEMADANEIESKRSALIVHLSSDMIS